MTSLTRVEIEVEGFEMKAVILAGGLGTRMKEETEYRPKPMVEIGGRPVLWHIMKNLSVQGFRDFVILAGYKSESISDYFSNYKTRNFDFTTNIGTGEIRFLGDVPFDEMEWNVTVLDTGSDALTGQRIRRCFDVMELGETFLLTYGDGLADVDISELVKVHSAGGRLATVTSVKASSRFGQLKHSGQLVTEFLEKPELDELISIGFFILEPGVRDFLEDKDLGAFEAQPLKNLVLSKQLGIYLHGGFWKAMDTYREYQDLNELWRSGAPWRTWP